MFVNLPIDIFFVEKPSTGNPDGKCPGGWKKYGGMCFKRFGKKEKWDSAEKQCNKYGGHLATIRDSGTLKFLTGVIKRYGWPWGDFLSTPWQTPKRSSYCIEIPLGKNTLDCLMWFVLRIKWRLLDHSDIFFSIRPLGPLLLTWINFNPSMNK